MPDLTAVDAEAAKEAEERDLLQAAILMRMADMLARSSTG